MNLIQLTMGDECGDGHAQSATISIMSSLSFNEIKKAFKNGAKALHLSSRGSYETAFMFCSDYDETKLSPNVCDKLRAGGLVPEDYSREVLGPGDFIHLSSETYANLWLAVAKIGNPSLEYKEVSLDKISIGGYGLFEM